MDKYTPYLSGKICKVYTHRVRELNDKFFLVSTKTSPEKMWLEKDVFEYFSPTKLRQNANQNEFTQKGRGRFPLLPRNGEEFLHVVQQAQEKKSKEKNELLEENQFFKNELETIYQVLSEENQNVLEKRIQEYYDEKEKENGFSFSKSSFPESIQQEQTFVPESIQQEPTFVPEENQQEDFTLPVEQDLFQIDEQHVTDPELEKLWDYIKSS